MFIGIVGEVSNFREGLEKVFFVFFDGVRGGSLGLVVFYVILGRIYSFSSF